MTTIDTTQPVARASNRPQRLHTCPECGERFKGPFDKRFCSIPHKSAWHNRSAKRGVVMMPLILAWRAGRGSTPEAKWAHAEMSRLADIWNGEDVKAGRMSAAKYLRPKINSGWSAVDYAFG